MTLPVSEIERVKKLDNVTVDSVPSPSIALLAINLERSYFQDKRIRQAMMCGIDRQGIVDQIYLGQGEVINSPIFGPAWMGTPEGLDPYAFDADRARQLLSDAGWDSSRKVEIIYGPVDQEKDASAAVMQQQLGDIGIKTDLLTLDWAEVTRRSVTTMDYEINYGGGGTFRADPSVSSTFFDSKNFSPNGGNSSHYKNPQVDQLFDQGVATSNTDDRKAIYTQVADILNDELPWISCGPPTPCMRLASGLLVSRHQAIPRTSSGTLRSGRSPHSDTC